MNWRNSYIGLGKKLIFLIILFALSKYANSYCCTCLCLGKHFTQNATKYFLQYMSPFSKVNCEVFSRVLCVSQNVFTICTIQANRYSTINDQCDHFERFKWRCIALTFRDSSCLKRSSKSLAERSGALRRWSTSDRACETWVISVR